MNRIFALVCVWICCIGISRGQEWKCVKTLIGHKSDVNTACFSPDNSKILTSSYDKSAKIWNSETGEIICTFQNSTYYTASFNPDGTQIVTTSWDKIEVWDLKNKNLFLTIKGHSSDVFYTMFSPDGTQIVTASNDKTAKIWDSKSGKLIITLSGHEEAVLSASFSPDGSQIVTASVDKTAKIWDSKSGNLLFTLNGHELGVISASYNSDGTQLVTTSWDKTTKIWDISTRSILYELNGHASVTKSSIFSSNGIKLVTASTDKTVKIWQFLSEQDLKSWRKNTLIENSNSKTWQFGNFLATHKGDYWAGEFKVWSEDKKQIKLKVYYEDAAKKPEIKLFSPANFHKCLEEEEQELRGFITARLQYEEQKRKEAEEAKRIALEQKQEAARQAAETARQRQAEAARAAQLKAASNKSTWKLGNKLCSNSGYQTMGVLDQWNEDKSQVKIKVIASETSTFEGESIQKNSLIWVSPKNFHTCLESEKQSYLNANALEEGNSGNSTSNKKSNSNELDAQMKVMAGKYARGLADKLAFKCRLTEYPRTTLSIHNVKKAIGTQTEFLVIECTIITREEGYASPNVYEGAFYVDMYGCNAFFFASKVDEKSFFGVLGGCSWQNVKDQEIDTKRSIYLNYPKAENGKFIFLECYE